MFDVANCIGHIIRANDRSTSHEATLEEPQGELEISSVAGQTPPMVISGHISSPGFMAKSSQMSSLAGQPPSMVISGHIS